MDNGKIIIYVLKNFIFLLKRTQAARNKKSMAVMIFLHPREFTNKKAPIGISNRGFPYI